MACGTCGKNKARFLTKVTKSKNAKIEPIPILDIPDDKLTPIQLRSKNRAIRAENRRKRIQRRNAKANLIKQKNDLKALKK